MNNFERIAIFIIRLISLLVLIYFLVIAIFLAALMRLYLSLLSLAPAILALLVYLGARFLARLIARDLD